MKINPIPDGYRSITPYLKLPNCGRLIEFLKQAFGGVEKARLVRPDGAVLHAEIVIGDSLLMTDLSDWHSRAMFTSARHNLAGGGGYKLCCGWSRWPLVTATRWMAFRNARALASTLSVETPRPR
jgi:hypothetical protein